MKKLALLVAVLTATSIVGCQNTAHQSGTDHPEEKVDSHDAIQLNQGQKWDVNPEMSPYILRSEEILSNYNGDAYKILASDLKEQNTHLVQSCTMTGKSHDELHKWLHPHMQLVSSLAKASNADEAAQIIDKLKSSFQTYHTYFQ